MRSALAYLRSMPARRPKKARSSTDTLADRLHAQRIAARFSQEELANEIGSNRAAFANYEIGRVRLPLSIGLAFCRRLNICPRWMISEEDPRSPFVEADELGIDEREIRRAIERGATFEEGYSQIFAEPLNRWIKKNPVRSLALRQLAGGPEQTARTLSLKELKSSIVEVAVQIHENPEDEDKARARVLKALVDELKRRFDLR